MIGAAGSLCLFLALLLSSLALVWIKKKHKRTATNKAQYTVRLGHRQREKSEQREEVEHQGDEAMEMKSNGAYICTTQQIPTEDNVAYGQATPQISTVDNVAYGQATPHIPTVDNVAYGQATPQIPTVDNVAYGQATPHIPTVDNVAYGQATPQIPTVDNVAYGQATPQIPTEDNVAYYYGGIESNGNHLSDQCEYEYVS